MKLLIEPVNKNKLYLDKIGGIILPLMDYAVESNVFFSLDEILEVTNNNSDVEVFVKINKNLMNADIDKVREILIELDKSNIKRKFL